MKIDSVLREFVEKYDIEAIDSINEIASDVGLVLKRSKLKLFNINEAYEKFNEFVDGYTNYKIENLHNEKATSHKSICESVNKFINGLLVESEVLYSELPSFVRTHINGTKTIIEKVDTWKKNMIEAGVDNESIGSINEFVDNFVDKINSLFESSMDKILWASGYNTRKKLAKLNRSNEIKPIFL